MGADFVKRKSDLVIALAGNPNVGKSTVFNALTGMNQHTGNWPGKTVATATGEFTAGKRHCTLVDLPGVYSLMAHSAEEEVARDFLCFGGADMAIVVADASCLERNLNLILQTIEIQPNTLVLVNLMDEAEKKQIRIDLSILQQKLGVPVLGSSARSGQGLDGLAGKIAAEDRFEGRSPIKIRYPEKIEEAIALIMAQLKKVHGFPDKRWVALKLLEGDAPLIENISQHLGVDLMSDAKLISSLEAARTRLWEGGITEENFKDHIVSTLYHIAEEICQDAVRFERSDYNARQLKADRILTSRRYGIPTMILLLLLVFYITMVGANYPSQLLADGLFYLQDRLSELFFALNAPSWLHGALVLGLYRVLAWVVSVMLPPMAIFFPLFTLLEDLGYLPRIAFNLDKYFKKCCACGKQALCMCMGFGCNACGVTGCRIIDSPRERLIAILTNCLVPCNGRFPTLIALITIFFAGSGAMGSILCALMLTGVILLGIWMTFLISRLLSKTVLRGMPSSFVLELPPYRRPQIGKVILRSILDRTLFVLGRAVMVAAPAGLLIWILANVHAEGISLLAHCTKFLDPLGRLMGLDGVILTAFLLGFPANEIVLSIIVMAYLSGGTLMEMGDLTSLKELLTANDWTPVTAVCMMLFSLFHWPCSTTVLTIRKETGSFKWTLLGVLIPTLLGMLLCMAVNGIAALFGI